jgi:hypothetical protein
MSLLRAGVLLFIISCMINSQLLFPYLPEINAFDETQYIASGRALLQGRLPQLAGSPLVAVLFALIQAVLQENPSWFVISEWIARITTHALLWLSLFLVAYQTRTLVHPLVPMLLLLSSPALSWLLGQVGMTDGLFAACAGLAFCLLLSYHERGSRCYLYASSTLLGLAALARNDGLIVIPILVILSITATWTYTSQGTRLGQLSLAMAAALLPAALIVISYLLIRGMSTGQFDAGVSARSYLAFEQGQTFIFHTQYGSAELAGLAQATDARRLYGTPEENRHSVFRAIARNPGAFAEREIRLLTTFPMVFGQAYELFAPVILVLCTLGVRSLILRRRYWLAAALVGWHAHLAVYLLTFIRPGYLLLPFFATLILAALGLAALHGRKRAVALGVLGCLATAVLVLRLIQAPPHGPALSTTPEEAIVRFMQETFHPGTRVAAFTAPLPTAAGMEWASMFSGLHHIQTAEELTAWIEQAGADVLYLDPALRLGLPRVYQLAEEQVGRQLSLAYMVSKRSPIALDSESGNRSGHQSEVEEQELKLLTVNGRPLETRSASPVAPE